MWRRGSTVGVAGKVVRWLALWLFGSDIGGGGGGRREAAVESDGGGGDLVVEAIVFVVMVAWLRWLW